VLRRRVSIVRHLPEALPIRTLSPILAEGENNQEDTGCEVFCIHSSNTPFPVGEQNEYPPTAGVEDLRISSEVKSNHWPAIHE